ncbi:MAG TPA: DUF2807 domain-containing protein [Chitinophagaceae bacterium]|nr:DUF2807 domain-containing protein [Chitinophagaceae bacterium]
MKKLTTALLLLAVAFASTSCKKDVIGAGPIVTQNRMVAPFTAIDLRMNGNVYYKKDSVWKVEVTAKQSLHASLETSVTNGQLTIRYSNGKTYDADESIRINVSAPDVASLKLASSGSIFCTTDITPASLFLLSAGSGSIFLQGVNTGNLKAQSLQSGTITATGGTAANEELKTDASGKIDLKEVATKTASVRIIGSGYIKVKVADHLNATIDGSGSVYFTGFPTLTTQISGTGRLVRL